MTSVVDLSNSTSLDDATVMKFFEFLKKPAYIAFDGRKMRLPDALPKTSCV